MAQAQLSATIPGALDERPTCPDCGVKLWLVRVERIGIHSDKRIFECPVCELAAGQAEAA